MANPIDLHKAGLARYFKFRNSIFILDILTDPSCIRFRESEEFSDCKLVCGPYHFNVHKIILSTQSEYFRIALRHGAFKEGESGIIELKAKQDDSDADESCDEPEIVKLMIEYFYHFDYALKPKVSTQELNEEPDKEPAEVSVERQDNLEHKPGYTSPHLKGQKAQAGPFLALADTEPIASPAASSSTAITHSKVFAMAVKYQIDGLRDLAFKRFDKAMETHWEDADFHDTIVSVHKSTPEDVPQLRSVIADAIFDHLDDFKHKDAMESVLCSIPGLVLGLLRHSRGPRDKYTCTQGHKYFSTTEVRCPGNKCGYSFFYCDSCRNNRVPVTCKRCGHWYR